MAVVMVGMDGLPHIAGGPSNVIREFGLSKKSLIRLDLNFNLNRI